MRQKTACIVALLAPAILAAQRQPLPDKFTPRPTVGAITAADLMTRVYAFADDSMMGRQTGTVHHDKATDYIARELARLGVAPAGENGTYFQPLPILSRTLAQDARLTVDGREFVAFRDYLPRDNGGNVEALVNAPAVYGGVFRPNDDSGLIDPAATRGKVVVFSVPAGWQANRGALILRYPAAAAVVVATLDSMPVNVREDLAAPLLVRAGASQQLPPVAFLYASAALTRAMLGADPAALKVGATGKTVNGKLNFVGKPAPGVRNVVAVLPGSDPALRGQYVAIGAHSDHEGFNASPVDHDSLQAFYRVVRPGGADDNDKQASPQDWTRVTALLDSLRRDRRPRQDSIFNGADDDASGSMGLLEVAEAFALAPAKPKRSILFVWHAAEEQGLVGARYFTDNPTVPRDSIVAQINLDMIGRGGPSDVPGGGPGYVELIGSRRLSTELGDIVDAEGAKANPPFTFSYEYDAPGHPAQYYCRSDHYMYARYGIPVVFMSTGGHAEYHQVTDEPQYLDYEKLARVTQLVYNVAARVANQGHRLVVDKPKPDPNARCVQ